MKLKIALVAPPYSGHLNPLLGIGRELRSIAEVTVLSTPGVMAAVESAGIPGIPILRRREKLIEEIAAPGRAVKNHPLWMFRQLKANASLQKELRGELDAAFAELAPDLVIADFTLPVAGAAALACGAKWWTAVPSPCVFETPDGPPAYCGGLLPAKSSGEKLKHWFLRKATRGFKRTLFRPVRHAFRPAGLEGIYRTDGSEAVYSPEMILACGVSEFEFAATYPAHFRFVGPSLFTPLPPLGEEPRFSDGKRHLLITLGSHLGHLKEGVAAEIGKLARERPDWVFHFSNGQAGEGDCRRERNFHRHSFISYDEFLPRYDAVVHHGGSGILNHCLKLAIPAVVMPIDFDQFDNAARLSRRGLAVVVKNPGEFGRALDELMVNSVFSENCRKFAEVMAGYDCGASVRRLVSEALIR